MLTLGIQSPAISPHVYLYKIYSSAVEIGFSFSYQGIGGHLAGGARKKTYHVELPCNRDN
jgi:hypothetical protein